MTRLVSVLLLGLLAIASPSFAAYDGPDPPLTYDRTFGFRVVFTTQAKVLDTGRARFTFEAHVPIAADNVGQTVQMRVRRPIDTQPFYENISDVCSSPTITAAQVGTTVVFTCEVFAQLFDLNVEVLLYPFVVRKSANPGGDLVHDGRPTPVTVPVDTSDPDEENDTQLVPTSLSLPVAVVDRVSRDPDWYQFTAAETGSAEIRIDFWDTVFRGNDLDIMIYNSGGELVGAGTVGDDSERAIINVVAGATYYFAVEAGEYTPTYYDLFVTAGATHSITITTAASGTPDPVASAGTVQMNVAASDSLAHDLTYNWKQVCPGLTTGTFSDRTIANPTWTAPVNTSGVTRSCTITVDVSDGVGGNTLTVSSSYTQEVQTTVHSLSITAGPTGTPNPVATGGSVALSVTAVDSFPEHTLTYAWQATCPSIGAGGTFTPSASVPNPVWTPTANDTSGPQICTLTVTVTDGQGLSASKGFTQTIVATAYTYYFAEGATIGGFFETRLALLNTDPGGTAAIAVDFQLMNPNPGTVLTHAINLGSLRRTTIEVSKLATLDSALASLVSAEFSMVVRSDRPLVVDRTMSWDGNGYGSHAETSISAPASTWYLAEGATIGAFELYYLIQNPNPTEVTYTVTYLLPSSSFSRNYTIGPNTRSNIPVHLEPGLGDAELSAIIESPAGQPIVVERAMYLTTGGIFWGAGHESAGIRAPAAEWFFAEGNTGDFFDLFILVGNPNDQDAQVTATFLFDDGTTCHTTETVKAKTRFNFWVDALVISDCQKNLADAAVSTKITSTVPVIAERAMWWPGPTAANWAEAHNSAGATATGIKWALADGEQGGARGNETYVLIANTSAYPGKATVTVYFDDGTAPVSRTYELAANSRTNVPIGAPADLGGFGDAVKDRKFGTIVESIAAAGQGAPAQIVVERAMYSNGPGALFWAAGTNALATKLQ